MSPARLPSRTAGAFMNGSARDVRGAFCTTATSSGNSSTAPSAPGMAGADHSSVSALASWARGAATGLALNVNDAVLKQCFAASKKV